MSSSKKIKLVSWNVNGIRACANKTFFNYLKEENPDILCVQETKALESDVDESLRQPSGYYSIWHSAQRKGYSGVAMFLKHKPLKSFEGFGNPTFDCEGRVVGAEFDNFYVFGVYFPNGGQGDERVAYKLNFYAAFFDYCETLRKTGKAVIVCGDYNTAHQEIDLARPKENKHVSGFLPIEREWLDKLIRDGWVDTYRDKYPYCKDVYSWWSYRARARENNVGWRIDYTFINKEHKHWIEDSFVQMDVTGSDHCPVGIIFESNA